MNRASIIIAQRYAQAFINLYVANVSSKNIEDAQALEHFLIERRNTLFLFNINSVSPSAQESALDSMLKKFHVLFLKPLAFLLLTSHRMSLLPEVLKQVRLAYQKFHNVQHFTFISSHPLSPEINDVLAKFLARSTDANIIYSNTIDKKLLAGIRLQSNMFLWEYSLAQQIRALQLPLIR